MLAAIQGRSIAGNPLHIEGLGDLRLSQAAKRLFGSWQAAVEAAGLIGKIPIKKPLRRRTPEQVLAELRNCHASDEQLTKLSRSNHSLYNAARAHFGSWSAAQSAAAYISTDTSMSVEAILKIVSDRWSIEEHFHDVKEIWGAGEQQVRNVWSSIGCRDVCGWPYAMVECESWHEPSERLVDRSDRPWDNPDKRPSHNDRRRRIARKMLHEAFLIDLPDAPENTAFCDRIERLLALAV